MQMEELLKKREQEGERRFGELALKLFETGREKEIIEAASNPNVCRRMPSIRLLKNSIYVLY